MRILFRNILQPVGRQRRIPESFVGFLFLTLGLTSCFTGVESTKRIELSKNDLRELAPSAEELLMSQVKPEVLRLWKPGKEFVVADQKISVLLRVEQGVRGKFRAGDRLRYVGVTPVPMPDGASNCGLILEDEAGCRYLLNSSRPMYECGETILSDRLPMLRDVRMLQVADSLLTGRTLWSRSHLVYDRDATRLETLKFIPVRVDSVTNGDSYFPMRVWTTDSVGELRFYYMGFNEDRAESRTISRIFSLTDPRLEYPNLPESHWQAIQRRQVIPGMTKDECRLALGAPSDATGGRNYSSTLDLWQYPDGTYLRFVDGLLVDYRR